LREATDTRITTSPAGLFRTSGCVAESADNTLYGRFIQIQQGYLSDSELLHFLHVRPPPKHRFFLCDLVAPLLPSAAADTVTSVAGTGEGWGKAEAKYLLPRPLTLVNQGHRRVTFLIGSLLALLIASSDVSLDILR
jgi:hypothetical protein